MTQNANGFVGVEDSEKNDQEPFPEALDFVEAAGRLVKVAQPSIKISDLEAGAVFLKINWDKTTSNRFDLLSVIIMRAFTAKRVKFDVDVMMKNEADIIGSPLT